MALIFKNPIYKASLDALRRLGLVRAETQIMQIHMHGAEIQQDRVSSEDLLSDVICRYEWPKKRLVRVYEPGIQPVEPNPFKFSVVATIAETGDCFIQALANPDRLNVADMKAGLRHLRQFGANALLWRHKGDWQRFER